MGEDEDAADAGEEAALDVQAEVDSEDDLDEEEEFEFRGVGGVDVVGELAAAVFVAEEVADDGHEGAEGLGGDVPAGVDELGRVSGVSGETGCDLLGSRGGSGGGTCGKAYP